MALTEMVVMPGVDYQAICDSVRAKTGGTALLKSGDIPAIIDAITGGGGGGSLPDGVSAIDCGTFTPTGTTSRTHTIDHNLGTIPDFVIVAAEGITTAAKTLFAYYYVAAKFTDAGTNTTYTGRQVVLWLGSSANPTFTAAYVSDITSIASDSDMTVGITNAATTFAAGTKYYWVAGVFDGFN